MQIYSIKAIQEVEHFYYDYLDKANKRKGLKDLYNVKDEKTINGLKDWLNSHRNDFMAHSGEEIESVKVEFSKNSLSIITI